MKLCFIRLHKWQLLWLYAQDQPMITCMYCNAGKFIERPRTEPTNFKPKILIKNEKTNTNNKGTKRTPSTYVNRNDKRLEE